MKKTPLPYLAALVLAAAVTVTVHATAAKQAWTQKIPGSVKWHQVTALGTLLVGTDDALLSYDPDDGKLLWKRDDIRKSNTNNAREITGTPYLVANNFAGIANSKITMQLLDFLEGKTLWSTPQMLGQYLDTIPVPEKNLVIFVLQTMSGQEDGIHLFAHDLATGEEKWKTRYCKSGGIPLHLADNSGKFVPTMDLSGYHDPVVDGDEMYLGYLGVHCVDLATGALKWGVEFPPGNKGLKRTYAPLRIEGDMIYGAGGGSVQAINRRTGQLAWKSDRVSDYAGLFKARDNAIVSQLEIVGDKVLARYGGNFSDGRAVQLREPLGVLILEAATGREIYHMDKPKEGLTNLMVLPEIHSVMFADAGYLHGIDLAGAQPAETFKVPIEFKRKMGGGDVAKIGLGLTGGLMGLTKAVVSQNKARLDVPVAITRMDGHIVVQGKQHLLGFDPVARDQKWSLYYAAPSDAFATMALFAVTLAASAQGNATAAPHSYGSSGYNRGANLVQSSLDRYNRFTEKRAARAAGSKSSDAYTYILTNVDKKGVGLLGVNLANGETDRELVLKDKEPDYSVDELTGRIYLIKGRDAIVCYEF